MPLVSNELDREAFRMPIFPWLYPTMAANARAGKLQSRIRDYDAAHSDDVRFGSNETRRATIHAREDIVLVYSLQTELHRQLVKISRGVWVMVLIAFVVVLHSWS